MIKPNIKKKKKERKFLLSKSEQIATFEKSFLNQIKLMT